MLTKREFERMSSEVSAVVKRRLRNHRRRSNLLTYEGTILDRLCFHFVSEAWPGGSYSVLCSVRPCMHPLLQSEVRDFAARNGHALVGYSGDCEVDHRGHRFLSVRCDNVAEAITERLRGTDGLLVLSGLLNGGARRNFQAINTESRSFRHESVPLPLLEPGPGTSADWKTLFLFEGFYPLQILATYLWLVSHDLEVHHIPLCYLTCYNEEQQVVLRDHLIQMKNAVLASLGCLRS